MNVVSFLGSALRCEHGSLGIHLDTQPLAASTDKDVVGWFGANGRERAWGAAILNFEKNSNICGLKNVNEGRKERKRSAHLPRHGDSFRQTHHSCLDSPPHPLLNSSLSSSPLSSSITPSLFHSKLKTYLFNNSFPP